MSYSITLFSSYNMLNMYSTDTIKHVVYSVPLFRIIPPELHHKSLTRNLVYRLYELRIWVNAVINLHNQCVTNE